MQIVSLETICMKRQSHFFCGGKGGGGVGGGGGGE